MVSINVAEVVRLQKTRGRSGLKSYDFSYGWRRRGRRTRIRRQGVATLDYALLLGIVMPSAAFVMWLAPQIITRVFEMSCTLVSWPFM